MSCRDQVDLACEVLTICMSNLSVGETTERYTDSLIRALNHPSANVRLMALKEASYTNFFQNYSMSFI